MYKCILHLVNKKVHPHSGPSLCSSAPKASKKIVLPKFLDQYMYKFSFKKPKKKVYNMSTS